MPETRIPTQKRSIEKRKKIIEKGFELMCSQGYHNVSTVDIAEFAGVSTGIIYQYFKDKKDIFVEGAKNYTDEIMYPMINVLQNEIVDIKNLDILVERIIDKFIETHTISQRAHREIMAMSQLDNDVSEIFKDSELKMTEKFVNLLENHEIFIEHSKEKIHIAYGIIDNFCHEIVYHKHEQINYNIMKSEVVRIIVGLLK